MDYFTSREMEAIQPRGFAEYMANYGEHFSKAMCEWAVSMMMIEVEEDDGKTRKQRIEPWTKEQVEEMLVRNGIELEHDKGYDKVYVANMCKADYYEDSVPEEMHVARYIKNTLDDPDGYEGQTFNRFVMDCIGMRVPIIWEDML